jgi:outer membrane protein assembly factor BamD (BamD/ComL family)
VWQTDGPRLIAEADAYLQTDPGAENAAYVGYLRAGAIHQIRPAEQAIDAFEAVVQAHPGTTWAGFSLAYLIRLYHDAGQEQQCLERLSTLTWQHARQPEVRRFTKQYLSDLLPELLPRVKVVNPDDPAPPEEHEEPR